MKKFLILFFLACPIIVAQTHTEVTVEDAQTITGAKVFTNATVSGPAVIDMAAAPVTGADLGAQMISCASLLPANGGFCSGTNLTGAGLLPISTPVTTSKPVVYLFCGQHISEGAAINLAAANSAIQGCAGGSTVFTKAANIDQITLSIANTSVTNLTLVGVSGSFTGSGLVVSASNVLVTGNNISGEAAQAIKNSGATVIGPSNIVSCNVAQPCITTGNNSSVSFNTCTSTLADCISLTGGNQVDIIGNYANLVVSAPVTGKCVINANQDQIGVRIAYNQTQITDGNGGDVNHGVCLTPSGTHDLNIIVEANNHFGVLSGGATADGFFLNNVNGLNTNWSVTVRSEGCVHLTFCIRRTDAQNNITHYENIQQGDVTLDAGTGSTSDTWTMLNGPAIAFASLPSPAGSGSLVLCTGVSFGVVATSGSNAGFCQGLGTNLWRLIGPGAPAVVSTTYSNATTTASNISGLAIPVVANQSYSIECNLAYQASGATAGLDVTITGPASPTFVISEYVEFQLGAVTTPFEAHANAFSTKMTGAASVDTNFNLAKVIILLSNGSNAGTVQIQGSATGAGTVTVYQNSWCKP
jgi:hypothetical protein